MKIFLITFLFIIIFINIVNSRPTQFLKPLLKVRESFLLNNEEPVCAKANCRKLGETCDDNMGSGNCGSSGGGCCAYGLNCLNNVCVENNLGASCFEADDCFGTASCINNVCVPTLYPNDACTAQDICIGATSCNTTSGVCQGLSSGTQCTVKGECAYGLYCDIDRQDATHICRPWKNPGSSCTVGTFECDILSQCIADSLGSLEGICRRIHSQSEGEPCNPMTEQTSQFSDCRLGLMCNEASGLCTTPPGGTQNQRCSSEDETCPEGVSCSCNHLVGELLCSTPFYAHSKCAQVYDSIATCVTSHQCSQLDTWTNDACIQKHCRPQATDLIDCFCPEVYPQVGKCVYFPWGSCETVVEPTVSSSDSGPSGGEIAGIVIGVIFGVVIVFALLVYFIHRRNKMANYQSIQ